MRTIQSVRVRPVCVPMSLPHRTASGLVSESPLVLTDIVTDDGVIGHSMVFTYTRAALGATAELVRNMEGLIVGEPLAPRDVEQKLSQRFRLLGTHGLVGIAIAAIDMALWDALARSHSTSLVELLGGSAKPIPAYGAVGYDGAEASAKSAAGWAELGLKGVKAKIGYPTVAEDVAVVRAIRRAIGNEVAIMVDYNQCLSPVEAIARIRLLDDEGLTWVEEPTLAHDFTGHATIAREAKTPIQCGENWWGALDLRHALDAGASDLIMADVMKIGGVTGWLRAVALARAAGLPVSNHLFPEISAQLLCLQQAADWLEYSNWWNPILASPLKLQDGLAVIDATIGTGIEWNDTAIEGYSA
ncbi:MAG TPA: enolase C-terminal domain-like protein [Chthonomonadaceae bacterium]|nr:enolase C-terminal domain-like protein [Chthonomonadaceae bacterium]